MGVARGREGARSSVMVRSEEREGVGEEDISG